MFSLFRRGTGPRLLGRLFGRCELEPHHDDCRRRLARAGETPRRLDLHGESGFRALHGRDPPWIV